MLLMLFLACPSAWWRDEQKSFGHTQMEALAQAGQLLCPLVTTQTGTAFNLPRAARALQTLV